MIATVNSFYRYEQYQQTISNTYNDRQPIMFDMYNSIILTCLYTLYS